jgi:nucleoside-diphosphate-sugar epimerase
MCLHVIDAAASALDRAGDAQAARAVRAAGYRISPPAANAEQAIAVQHTDGERMFTHIGFRPQVSLQDGLAQTAEFYRAYFASRALPHVPGTTQNG